MQFTDFLSRKWNIERSFFDKEVMGYDPKTKKDQTWPYYDSEEVSHKKWLEQVQDPITKKFFKGRKTTVEYDNDGKEIPETRKELELEPYFERTQIVRYRTRNNQEFLYSRGIMYGWTTYGSGPITTHFQEAEQWDEWQFKHTLDFIPRENKHREISRGPIGTINHNIMPFTPENVDILMENAIPNVRLSLKHEGRPDAKECKDLTMFKTKPFDYIFNDEWQTAEQRERARQEFEAIQNNLVQSRQNNKRQGNAS